jgi:hypothetical protein
MPGSNSYVLIVALAVLCLAALVAARYPRSGESQFDYLQQGRYNW